MSSSQFGRHLNPHRRLRDPLGVKGIRQSVVITNNPSTIGENQQLLVRFPNLERNDVIVPGSARLAFTIALTSTDGTRSVVQNLGRAIVRKTTIRISGNEIMSLEDSDVYQCYKDLWRTHSARRSMAYQGIDQNGTVNPLNMLKLRVGSTAVDASVWADIATADAFGTRFCIPLDFELLEAHSPYYQAGLGDRLEYELTFNSFARVIHSSDTAASYTIENISLEFEKVTNELLARQIANQYAGRTRILYDRVLRHRKVHLDKSDLLWNINLNVPMRSCKGILLLFEDTVNNPNWARNTESFYNPGITKVEMTVEGVPNQLYSQGMKAYQQWGEASKFFASAGSNHHAMVAATAQDLVLSDVNIGDYLTEKYALWLDLRSTDDASLHGTGRRIMNASEGITLQIAKTAADGAGALNMYIFLVMDAQLNIEDGRFVSADY